jgi:hypothetical protein
MHYISLTVSTLLCIRSLSVLSLRGLQSGLSDVHILLTMCSIFPFLVYYTVHKGYSKNKRSASEAAFSFIILKIDVKKLSGTQSRFVAMRAFAR